MQGNKLLIDELSKLDPIKPYGTELFNAIARVSISVAIEANWIDLKNGEAHIYLTKRSESETAYPGQWHIPGSVLRRGESFDDVIHRLSSKEFFCTMRLSKFVGLVNNINEDRGHFISLVYLVEPISLPWQFSGEWFPINHLPKNTIDFHVSKVVPMALGAFIAQNS